MDIEKLKVLAPAATPELGAIPFTAADTRFMVECGPATVLALIAEVERLRAELAAGAAHQCGDTILDGIPKYEWWLIDREGDEEYVKVSDIKKRLGAAPAAGTVEKDAERLDWLERTNQTFCGNYSNTGFRAIGSSIWHGTLREAIDGAMQKDAAIEAHKARSPSCGS
jgi:hypothetical protein